MSEQTRQDNKNAATLWRDAAERKRRVDAGSTTPSQTSRFDTDFGNLLTGIGNEAKWRTDRDARRARQGRAQNTKDDLTLTSQVEQSHSARCNMASGATYYRGGPFCGTAMECFVGASVPRAWLHNLKRGAYGSCGELDSERHSRLQMGTRLAAQVLDIEYLGGVSFYGEYGLDASLFSFGGNAGLLFSSDDAYRANYFELRGWTAEYEYSGTGRAVYFKKGDVTKNMICRVFASVACGAPVQSFSDPSA